MSTIDINNIPPHEKRIITKYEIVSGKVMIIYEIQIKDIDTDKFIVAERAMSATGKTKAELINDRETQRDNIIALHQKEIDKIKAIE